MILQRTFEQNWKIFTNRIIKELNDEAREQNSATNSGSRKTKTIL